MNSLVKVISTPQTEYLWECLLVCVGGFESQLWFRPNSFVHFHVSHNYMLYDMYDMFSDNTLNVAQFQNEYCCPLEINFFLLGFTSFLLVMFSAALLHRKQSSLV